MILRRLYTDDLPALTKVIPTVLVSWWVTGFSLCAILVRLGGRLVRTGKLFHEDKIMALSIIPLLARMALVHLVLIWGTNNLGKVGLTDYTFDEEHQSIGSRLVLGSRIFFAAFIWMQKLTITESLRRLISQFWKAGYDIFLNSIRWFLLATFIAVFISTLAECRPITHYWQVTPDPGPQCRQAYGQLITMGTLNIITDLILIFLPISIVLTNRFTTKRKMQLTLLFCLSFVPIAVTAYRVPKIISVGGRQQFRSLWASLEILAATGAANALVIGSFIRDRGPKKLKFKYGSQSESLERPQTNRRRPSYWGSDEDLVRDMGIHLDPELRHYDETPQVRPAPMAVAAPENGKPAPPKGIHTASWEFAEDDASSDVDLKATEPRREADEVPATPPSRKLSFFDVGGLLESGPHRRSESLANTTVSNGMSSSSSAQDFGDYGRRGSSALLHDIGGLLSTPTPTSAPSASATSRSQPPPNSRLQTQVANFNRSRSANRALHEALAEEPPAHIIQANAAGVPISRHDTLHSLQDAGGLLAATSQADHAR